MGKTNRARTVAVPTHHAVGVFGKRDIGVELVDQPGELVEG